MNDPDTLRAWLLILFLYAVAISCLAVRFYCGWCDEQRTTTTGSEDRLQKNKDLEAELKDCKLKSETAENDRREESLKLADALEDVEELRDKLKTDTEAQVELFRSMQANLSQQLEESEAKVKSAEQDAARWQKDAQDATAEREGQRHKAHAELTAARKELVECQQNLERMAAARNELDDRFVAARKILAGAPMSEAAEPAEPKPVANFPVANFLTFYKTGKWIEPDTETRGQQE